MPKNFFEDMVRMKNQQRKSVEPNFSAPEPIRQETPRQIEDDEIETKFASIYDVADNAKEKKPRSTIWLVAAFSVIFLLFALSYLFSGANITLYPKVQTVVLSKTLTATKESSPDSLSFDIVKISGEETKTIQGGQEKDVATRAKGQVIIFNTYSTASQNLDIDTRLEGSNGKMYKTLTKTTVPGMSKTGTAGQVTVNIYANEPGDSYNSDLIDFKIFGFKGTPKYAKFNARSKTPNTGGFLGKSRDISDEDKMKAVNELKDVLQSKLAQKATDQIPEGFVMLKTASSLNIDSQTIGDASTADVSEVPLTVKGTFYGLIFNEKDLTKAIAQSSVTNYDGSDLRIENIADIGASLSTETSLKDAVTINVTLSGNAVVVSGIDTDKLMLDVLGKPKKEFNSILTLYPNISSAESTIKPFWKMSFPDKEQDIKITVVEPK